MISKQLSPPNSEDSEDEEDPLEIAQKQRELNPNLQPLLNTNSSIHKSKSVRRKPPPELEYISGQSSTLKLKDSFTRRKSLIQEHTPSHTYSVPPSTPDSLTLDPTPFWKYHILKFGKGLYLTTNPDLKHMYCRNAPGYYIKIISNTPTISSDQGYSLVFKETSEIMTIIKHPKSQGGFFEFCVPKDKYINSDGIFETNGNVRIFRGFSYSRTIDSKYFPFDNLREKYARFFKNYQITDMNNNKWNIGSIPRVRLSKLNKLKTKVKSITEENNHDDDELKLIGKRNIYFHRNYFSDNTFYLHDQDFPPVLSMFRQYETKPVKRIQQSVKRKRQSLIQNTYISKDSELGVKYYHGRENASQDDNPDENKLGWITIYDDAILRNQGMFEFVLGMTLAVGFDSCLDK